MSELDLRAASSEALNDLQTSTVPPAEPAAVETAPPVDTPALSTPEGEETPAVPTAQVDTSQPPAAEETATQKWVINRKGQQVEITDPNEVQNLIRQGYDYTQKTMELAEQRRLVEAQLLQARTWLNNPSNVREYLQRLEAANPQPPAPQAPDPESLVTAAEVQAQLRASMVQAQQTMAQQAQHMVQSALLEAETARYTQEYSGVVQQTMQSLINEKFPILQDVEKVDRLILDDVAEKVKARVLLEPEHVATIDEVKKLMVASAEARAGKLNARLQNHLKMEAVRAAKLTDKGAEPKGGAPPVPEADPKHKLGSKELTHSVIAELQAAFDKKG